MQHLGVNRLPRIVKIIFVGSAAIAFGGGNGLAEDKVGSNADEKSAKVEDIQDDGVTDPLSVQEIGPSYYIGVAPEYINLKANGGSIGAWGIATGPALFINTQNIVRLQIRQMYFLGENLSARFTGFSAEVGHFFLDTPGHSHTVWSDGQSEVAKLIRQVPLSLEGYISISQYSYLGAKTVPYSGFGLGGRMDYRLTESLRLGFNLSMDSLRAVDQTLSAFRVSLPIMFVLPPK